MGEDNQLAQELEALKRRLQVFEDKEAIRDVLVRYSFNSDLNRTDGCARLWTEDAIWDGDPLGLLKGRDEIIKKIWTGPLHQSLTNHSQHLHLNFKIDVDGDTATAVGYVLHTLQWQGGFGIWRCAFRLFRLRRVDGQWLIHQTILHPTGDPECQSLIPAEW